MTRLTTLFSLFVLFSGAGCSDDGGVGDAGTDDTGTMDSATDAPPMDGGPDTATDAGGDGGGDPDVGPPGSWTPPRGIPMPEFGVNETVEDTCGDLTTVAFTDLESLSDLAAGTVIEIPVGTHTASRTITISGTGTACQPIFVRGASSDARPVIHADVEISGSYVIVENLDFDLSTDENHRVGFDASDHTALRTSEVHGLDIRRNSTIVFMSNATHTVIYGNHIHDNGDFSAPGEIDVHGIGAGMSWDAWIVDNHIHHNRGDGMQFGHQADNTLGRFYVGRNDIHDNGENSVDIKEASNVVISENRLHGETEGNVVLHDCPVNAALIFNEVYDAQYGVSLPSLESNCDDELPVSLFVLGNDFHDITENGVQGWSSGKTYFIASNTFMTVGTNIEVDPISAESSVSEDETAFEAGAAAFEAIYGIDIRP